jgi:hypothetical protein
VEAVPRVALLEGHAPHARLAGPRRIARARRVVLARAARHEHAHVADRIVRIDAHEVHHDARAVPRRVELEHEAVRPALDDPPRVREPTDPPREDLELTLALPEHHVATRRMRGRVPREQRPHDLPFLEACGPAVRIEHDRRATFPLLDRARDPRAPRPHEIDEGQLARPVDDQVEVRADAMRQRGGGIARRLTRRAALAAHRPDDDRETGHR